MICNIAVQLLSNCRRDGKAITLSHDALLVALVSTAEAVKEAADAKQKAASAETTVATDSNPTADVTDPDPSKAAPQASDAVADGQTERVMSGQAASSSQAAPLKPKSSGPYAPGTGTERETGCASKQVLFSIRHTLIFRRKMFVTPCK